MACFCRNHITGILFWIPKTNSIMIKTYFKIAYRNLSHNKTYGFLNVMGLALSITCGILIFSLVKYHLSFDNFHANSSRIYRFVTEQHRDDIHYTGSVPPAFGNAFRSDYSFDEQTARIVAADRTMPANAVPSC